MARANTALLDSGDIFPTIEFPTVSGGRIKVPDDLLGAWSVVLFYRGIWCRQDRQQLLDYELRTDIYRSLNMKVVAASVQPLDLAEQTVRELRLTFPIGYGLDAKAVSVLTGAFYDDSQELPFLHATGFLLTPEGRIFNAVYSSRSIGRFTAQDAATIVELIRSR